MEKEIVYKGSVDYVGTLAGLKKAGEYVVIPTSNQDIASIRTAVTKAAQKIENGATFSVHKTINGAKIERTS